MSRYANPGALRVPVEILRREKRKDKDGYPSTSLSNLFGEGKKVWCKWVNAHGTEVLNAMQLGLSEAATLTMRYSAKVTPDCVVRKGGALYEIVSLDNVGERGAWLEVKARRVAESV